MKNLLHYLTKLCGRKTPSEKSNGPQPGELIFCESGNGRAWHLRRLDPRGPAYSGRGGLISLCGTKVAWDIRCAVTPHTLQASQDDYGYPCGDCKKRIGP
jgi:hypothetical protein